VGKFSKRLTWTGGVIMEKRIAGWARELEKLDAGRILSWAARTFKGKVAFASSMGPEDQVITHMIGTKKIPVDIFTLDTGRLFQETCELIEKTSQRYGLDIRVYFPRTRKVEEMIHSHGINLFRKGVELRKLCCQVRKVEPLKRALRPLEAWICGLRREQSITRRDLQVVEWDDCNGLVKINPLFLWNEKDVWSYIRENDVPYNSLHDKGYPSIGCASCTRAVKAGEGVRAGRWWWETPEQKECGLHGRDGKPAGRGAKKAPIGE